jgi:hypothetical protein
MTLAMKEAITCQLESDDGGYNDFEMLDVVCVLHRTHEDKNGVARDKYGLQNAQQLLWEFLSKLRVNGEKEEDEDFDSIFGSDAIADSLPIIHGAIPPPLIDHHGSTKSLRLTLLVDRYRFATEDGEYLRTYLATIQEDNRQFARD